MRRRQPNPKFRKPADLNKRDSEHYAVASSLTGEFTSEEFKSRYRSRFPRRNEGSIIPSDYCFNRNNRGNAAYPRFLLWDGDRRYEFVGLDGEQDRGADVSGTRPQRLPEPPRPIDPPVVGSSWGDGQSRLFVRTDPAPLRLRRDIAERAVREFNSDSSVLGQERQAFASLGAGFQPGRVVEQLRTLNAAYSTRSVGVDLEIIGTAIEEDWRTWSAALHASPDLTGRVTDLDQLRALLAPFLGSDTRRKPRSLATKALHFGAPKALIPADSYAANALGRALGAGSWAQTDGLGTDGMARWYESYLKVIHRIGQENVELMEDLIELDARTFGEPGAERIRGLPKLIDKLLWWVGKEAKQGRHHELFEPM